MSKRLEKLLERLMFNSRWLLAPLYVGLVGAMLVLAIKFVQELAHFVPHIFSFSHGEVTLAALTLVDISLIGNLLLMVIFSGYENFVSKIDVHDHEDRPEWMGKIDFSGLKIKLVASMVAISGIELLKAFININGLTDHELAWKVGIHLTFVVSGVLLAWMDRIGEPPEHSAHATATARAEETRKAA